VNKIIKNTPPKVNVSIDSRLGFKPFAVGGSFCTDYHYVSKIMSEIRRTYGLAKIKILISKILYTQYWCNYSINDIEGEEWRSLAGIYNGVYKISSHGRCKRLVGYGCWQERILKQNIVNGVCRVTLSVNKKKEQLGIHTLVASAFVPFVEGKPIIHHDNDISVYNHYKNLIRATQKENVNAGFIKGRICKNLPPSIKGELHPSFGKSLSTETKNKISNSRKRYSDEFIRLVIKEFNLGNTITELNKRHGISISYLSQLVNKKVNRC